MFPLVISELIVGVLLVCRIGRTGPYLVSAGLVVLFSLFVLHLIVRGSPAGCGCGFALDRLPSGVENAVAVLRNCVLLALIAIGTVLATACPHPRAGIQ